MSKDTVKFKVLKAPREIFIPLRHGSQKNKPLIKAVSELRPGQAVFVTLPNGKTIKQYRNSLSQIFCNRRASGAHLKGKCSLRTTPTGIWIFRIDRLPQKKVTV